MRCKGDENISLEIKVFKSFSTPREFRGEGGGGRRKKLTLENTCNSVDFVWFSGVNKRWVINRRQQSVKGDY